MSSRHSSSANESLPAVPVSLGSIFRALIGPGHAPYPDVPEPEGLAQALGLDDSRPTIPLEDCVCPICLEYFIDIVETSCSHRFCKFCLENWLRVSSHRQCPTCRRNVDNIQVLPQLQSDIQEAIRSELDPVATNERIRIQSERQALLEAFSRERQTTQALISRINSSRERARLRSDPAAQRDYIGSALGEAENLLSRQIMNWWDGSQEPEGSQRDIPRINDNNVQGEVEIEEVPDNWQTFPRTRVLRDRTTPQMPQVSTAFNRNSMGSAQTAAVTSTSTGSPNGTDNQERQSLLPELEQIVYQDNLMEEYNYHLRRVNSAYTRIREAHRDFNYHNGRMQQIFDEFRSYFERLSQDQPSSADRNNNPVDYEDYDLIRSEISELLNNFPSQRVLRRIPPDQAIADFRRLRSGVQAVLFGAGNRIRNARSRGMEANFMSNSNRLQSNYSPYPVFAENSAAPVTNILDMEQEIQNRRTQLNGMSSSPNWPLRRYINNDTTSGRFQTPPNLPLPSTRDVQELRTERGMLRPSTAHQQSTTERMLVPRHETTSATMTSRRMRRRPAITNMLRERETTTSAQTSFSSSGSLQVREMHGLSRAVVSPIVRRNATVVRDNGVIPISNNVVSTERPEMTITHRSAFVPGPNADQSRQRRTITGRRRLPRGLINSSNNTSESESDRGETENSSRREIGDRTGSTRYTLPPSPLPGSMRRPLSAPENIRPESVCTSLRTLQRVQNSVASPPQRVSNSNSVLSSTTTTVEEITNQGQDVNRGFTEIVPVESRPAGEQGDIEVVHEIGRTSEALNMSIGDDVSNNNIHTPFSVENSSTPIEDRFKALCDKLQIHRPPPEP